MERLQQEIALLERVRARKMLAARDVEVLDSMLESRRTLLYQLRQQSRAPERVQGTFKGIKGSSVSLYSHCPIDTADRTHAAVQP